MGHLSAGPQGLECTVSLGESRHPVNMGQRCGDPAGRIPDSDIACWMVGPVDMMGVPWPPDEQIAGRYGVDLWQFLLG
jgi:hypothetical protein